MVIADLITLYLGWIEFPIIPVEHDFKVTDVEFHQIRALGLCKNLEDWPRNLRSHHLGNRVILYFELLAFAVLLSSLQTFGLV